eukprot:COSAG04_NODE_618_length_11896_cov_81.925659_1_plen_99_part_00
MGASCRRHAGAKPAPTFLKTLRHADLFSFSQLCFGGLFFSSSSLSSDCGVFAQVGETAEVFCAPRYAEGFSELQMVLLRQEHAAGCPGMFPNHRQFIA